MSGGRIRCCAIATLASASLLVVADRTFAADLGGDCCADLEERIAELEATTARKGNRKVSLTVSGWISEGLMYWDDGTESNVYQAQDSTDLASNVAFTGSAQINADWSAGYTIRLFLDHANALFQNQDNDNLSFGLNLQYSFWWLESKQLGKVSVGLQSGAADNAVILTDFTGTLFQHNAVIFEGVSLFLTPEGGTRSATGTFGAATGVPSSALGALVLCNTIRQGIANDCLGNRTNQIRYDTPTFAGFSASASWGEDDRWETTGRYAGEAGGFKYSFAVSYGEVNGDNDFLGTRSDFLGNPIDSSFLQVGGTIKHLATNLWFHGYYGQQDTDNAVISPGDGYSYYLKAGWSPTLNALGRTHVIGEYRENIDTYGAAFQLGDPGIGGRGAVCDGFTGTGGNIGAACAAPGIVNVTGSEVQSWGVGLVQEIDAASLALWVKYRHFESEIDFSRTGLNAVSGTQEFEDIDLIFAGAHLFF